MIRTIPLNLQVTPEQALSLMALRAKFAEVCNAIVPFARENKIKNPIALHYISYHAVRKQIPDHPADMVLRAEQKVAMAYRGILARHAKRTDEDWPIITFKPKMSVTFSDACFRILKEQDAVTMVTGYKQRERIPFLIGPKHRNMLRKGKAKEAQLVRVGKKWFLNVSVELPDSEPWGDGGVLGVDLGQNNLAVTSDGTIYKGGKLKDDRNRASALRERLQHNGSKSAIRHLKRASGREARHTRNVNHVISKAIVLDALFSDKSYIAMEDLTNIRTSAKVYGKRQRRYLHGWPFWQLQFFIQYKAEEAGIATIKVPPAYTSKTCSVCGSHGIRVRNSFHCSDPNCGRFAHSDRNAAVNIANLGASVVAPTGSVSIPNVAALLKG